MGLFLTREANDGRKEAIIHPYLGNCEYLPTVLSDLEQKLLIANIPATIKS
jgi:hypothetical protein